MSLAWMVIRKQGCVWAVPSSRIGRIASSDSGCILEVGEHRLDADAVLTTLRTLDVAPVGDFLASMVAEGCSGLGVWNKRPVVVIDPDNPPAALRVSSDDESGALEEIDDEI